MNSPIQFSFFLRPVTENEVKDIISSLDTRKAAGHDGIVVKLVKDASKEILKPLCSLINLSFSKGIFPDDLKIARVLPIYKKGNPEDMGNYRPISILPIFSKSFEKLVYEQISEFPGQT